MVNFGKYLDAPNIRVGLFVGGVDEKAQKEALQQGVCTLELYSGLFLISTVTFDKSETLLINLN